MGGGCVIEMAGEFYLTFSFRFLLGLVEVEGERFRVLMGLREIESEDIYRTYLQKGN